MELKTATGSLVDLEADCAVVGVYQGMMESPLPGAAGQVDEALDGQISALIEDGEIRGRSGEITIIHTTGRITQDSSPRCAPLGMTDREVRSVLWPVGVSGRGESG